MTEWNHNRLLRDLAEHYRSQGKIVFLDQNMGPAGMPRPDLLTINKTQTHVSQRLGNILQRLPRLYGKAGYVLLDALSESDTAEKTMIDRHTLAKEQAELNEKLLKLTQFTLTETFRDLFAEDRKLLAKQMRVMAKYNDILSQRIARFDI